MILPGVVVDEIELVDRHDDVRHPQQRADSQVAPGLLEDAVAHVHQHHQHIGRRGAGDGVAGVLHVSGAVGQDEGAPRGREVTVGDVDRDALLPLGPQAVGEQRQVGAGEAALVADPLDGVELVGEDRLGVEEQPPHQSGLAVVDRSGGGQPEQPALGEQLGSVESRLIRIDGIRGDGIGRGEGRSHCSGVGAHQK